MSETSGEPRLCPSEGEYGHCGLAPGHDGNHAVLIGDGVWFGYARGTGKAIGYCRIVDGQLAAIP